MCIRDSLYTTPVWSAVAVGTANFANPFATVDVIDGIADYCERYGVDDVNDLIGALEC